MTALTTSLTLGLDCKIDDFAFQLYDRWGGLVFESIQPDFSLSDNDLDPGPYLYQLIYTYRDENGSIRSELVSDLIYVIT